jgi:hypothetical protein
MGALAEKKTRWEEDIYFAVKLAQEKLRKYYAKVTPNTDMLLNPANIFDPLQKLLTFTKQYKGMDINSDE